MVKVWLDGWGMSWRECTINFCINRIKSCYWMHACGWFTMWPCGRQVFIYNILMMQPSVGRSAQPTAGMYRREHWLRFSNQIEAEVRVSCQVNVSTGCGHGNILSVWRNFLAMTKTQLRGGYTCRRQITIRWEDPDTKLILPFGFWRVDIRDGCLSDNRYKVPHRYHQI